MVVLMQPKMIDGHEVVTNGITVWVNSGVDGRTLARFCQFSGEISGDGDAAALTPGSGGGPLPETTIADWQQFCEGVEQQHGVCLLEESMPSRLKELRDYRPLPTGETTQDPDVFADAWTQFAEPVRVAMDAELVEFGPGVTYIVDEIRATLSNEMVKRLNVALARKME